MFYKKLEFKPDRLVFQDSEPQNGEGNDGEVVDDTAEQAQQTIQESLQEAQLLTEHLIPSPNGEWQGQDVVFWGGRDEEIGDDDDGTADERVPLVIMQNEGSYFYIVQEGDSRDDVYDYFTETMADQDPERFGYLAEVRASKAGQSRSFNIDGGDTFKVGTLVPVFLNPETRPVSTVDFVNEYARPTLEIIKHDEFYAPYVKYLIDTMGEERLLSMMVAVACAETSYPIGTGVFHKYENQHKAFSLSCFHVLMNKDSPGMRARQRLQMSEGQTYQYSNACRLFLAFLIEKALEECDGAACNQDTISKEEKVRQALDVYQDDSSFRFQELETDGNIDKAIRTLNDEYGYLRNPSPYIKKLERYLSLMGRKVTSLQAKDGVGMGVDEDGPYVVFFNSKTPKAKEGETKSCSGKVRIDYSPSKVMGEVIGDFPDEQGWSYAGFQSFYGADTGDNYSGQLETRYTETLTWLQGGDPPVDPREVAAATTFEQLTPEEVEKNYPAYGALFAPSSTGLSPLKYLEHANASYESSPVITENPLPKLAEYYFQPYLNYLESNNRGPASTVLTDQLGLIRNNNDDEDISMLFCRDKKCQEFTAREYHKRHVMGVHTIEEEGDSVFDLLNDCLGIEEDMLWDIDYYVERISEFLESRMEGGLYPLPGDEIAYGLNSFGELFVIYNTGNGEGGMIIDQSEDDVFITPPPLSDGGGDDGRVVPEVQPSPEVVGDNLLGIHEVVKKVQAESGDDLNMIIRLRTRLDMTLTKDQRTSLLAQGQEFLKGPGNSRGEPQLHDWVGYGYDNPAAKEGVYIVICRKNGRDCSAKLYP